METYSPHPDPECSHEWRYEGSGACHLARLWVDVHDSLWVESVDGQRVVVPRELRALVAKRVKEA